MTRQTNRASAPVRSGTGTLQSPLYEFDLEYGVEVRPSSGRLSPDADFGWSDVLTWVLNPENNAGLCALGMAPDDLLDRHRLMQLVYGPDHTQDDREGSVFAIRTRSGKYSKVQLQANNDFRWRTYDDPLYLDVNIVLGSAPSRFLTRYVAECTYDSPYGRKTCCSGTFGPDGGVMRGQVSDDSVAFPSEVLIAIAVDFAPETHLTGIVKNFAQPVTDTGVNFLFEPNEVLQTTAVMFDLRPTPLNGDYLALRWKHNGAGGVIASGQKYLSGSDLGRNTGPYDIVFQQDPIRADNIEIEMLGRLQNRDIVRFSQTFKLPDSVLILLTATWDQTASAYRLISQFQD